MELQFVNCSKVYSYTASESYLSSGRDGVSTKTPGTWFQYVKKSKEIL